jgi:hypothetical protein
VAAVTTDQLEPLLEGATDTGGMRSFTPESPTGGDQEGGDESEPLPGDRHYPWLERHLQQLFKQHVGAVGQHHRQHHMQQTANNHAIVSQGRGTHVLLCGWCMGFGRLRHHLQN